MKCEKSDRRHLSLLYGLMSAGGTVARQAIKQACTTAVSPIQTFRQSIDPELRPELRPVAYEAFDFEAGAPQVAYRETITKRVEDSGSSIRRLRPAPWGTSNPSPPESAAPLPPCRARPPIQSPDASPRAFARPGPQRIGTNFLIRLLARPVLLPRRSLPALRCGAVMRSKVRGL